MAVNHFASMERESQAIARAGRSRSTASRAASMSATGSESLCPLPAIFDKNKGIPGVDEHARFRQAAQAEHPDREQDHAHVAQSEEQFHRSGTVPQVCGDREGDLHERRIDRGDVPVVDARMERVAKVSDFLAVRRVRIGIDTLKLHPGVPQVPVDIVGKRRGLNCRMTRHRIATARMNQYRLRSCAPFDRV